LAGLRVYELARKYDVSSETMLAALRELGFSVKTHMIGVTEDMAAAAEKRFGKKSSAPKTKAAPKKPAARKTKEKTATAKKKESPAAAKPAAKTEAAPPRPAHKKVREAPAPPRSAASPGKPVTVKPPGHATAEGRPFPKGKVDVKAKPVVPDVRKPKPLPKTKLSQIEAQQKAVRDSVRRTLAKLEVTRKTRRRKDKTRADEVAEEQPAKVTGEGSVREIASLFGVESAEILQKCIELGVPATINQKLDRETIELLSEGFRIPVEFDSKSTESIATAPQHIDPSKLKSRAPIVTVMGHVDHGKTSILDYIRHSDVAGGEAGGITQHIGAYEIETKHGKITFIDTPGHEAFTSMRARGASVTDVVVLVVAADDGVMPQTLEAINHARAAGVPVVVAINKIDLPGAMPDRVKQQLGDRNILVEDFGGDVVCQEVSAKTGQGIDKLLELISLQAEMLELKAPVDCPANGVIVEVKKEEGRGILCTVIVKQGSLKIGDVFVAGEHYGKVRALLDHVGASLKSAGPSTPVLVLGCNGLPNPGELFTVVRDEREARETSVEKQLLQRNKDLRSAKKLTLEELYSQIQQGVLKELKLIVKGDMNGSVEALNDSLVDLSTEEVKVNIIHSGVGFITESDVLLAESSNALIIGFSVKASPKAEELAQKAHVEIRHYSIIYECLTEIKDAIAGMLEPEMVEKTLGKAEVRKVFKVSKSGTIAGSMVLEGTISRNALTRILRDNQIVFQGKVTSLKRFHDDVREVQKDFECGIGVGGFAEIEEGDIIETYTIEEKSKVML
jgi:translation initiation factor IF-2